jgi:predicted Zn-dependent protease
MRGKSWTYTFDIIDKNEVNAFALPGGPIFFYSGILSKMTTKDQMAGVVGHEIVHVLNQHWASQYADNTKRRLGILAVLTILNAGDTVFDLASVGDALYSLGYSRKHETESDKVGYDIMMRAGYNPNGMAEVFEMLAKEGGGGGPEWARTHPDANKRVASIREMVKKETRPLPAVRARDAKSIAAGTTASPGERLPGKGGGTSLRPGGTQRSTPHWLDCGC